MPDKLRRRLTGDLDNILLKALRKEPEQRYSSVEQFAEDITRHLSGKTVIARPATLRYRIGKYIKRRRALTATVSFLLLALITGLILTIWQLRASRIRERSDRHRFYAADMRQAAYDYSDGNLVEMSDLLERHRPGSGLDDEWRGFEWNLLWKLLHRERLVLQRRNWVYTFAYTPDGRKLFTSDRDGQIETWNTATGQSLGNFVSLPTGETWISLAPDGKRLAIYGPEIGFRILDVATKRLLGELYNSELGRVGHIAFSPDGNTFVCTFSRGQHSIVHLMDAETGRQIWQICEIDDLIRKLEFSPDGRFLAIGGHKGTLRLWDTKAKRQFAILDMELASQTATSLTFTSDGSFLYAGARDGRLHEFDVAARRRRRVWAAHSKLIDGLTVTHDGKIIATSGDDTTVRLWDAATGREITVVKNEGPISSLQFSPDNHSLAGVCMRQMRVKIWDVQELLSLPLVISNECQVESLAFSRQSDMLAFGGECGITTLRNLATGQQTDLHRGSNCFPRSLDFSPDGKLLAAYCVDDVKQISQFQVREVGSGKVLATTEGWGKSGFSPDGKTLPMIYGNKLKLWDWAAGLEQLIDVGGLGSVRNLSFSPDGGQMVTSLNNESLAKVYDVTGKRLSLTLKGHRALVWDARFSPDGKMIATASWDYTVKLWDAQTGRELRTLKHGGSVYTVAFSPDSKRLASGGEDNLVRLWDTETGMEMAALKGHTKKIQALAFSPDGQTLASASWDGTFRLYRAATEQEVQAKLPMLNPAQK